MWKTALIGMTVVLAIARTQASHADDRSHDGFGQERYQLTAEDRSALLDARIAALKAGLRLTVNQQANWPAFEQALRNVAKVRFDRMQARRSEVPSGDPIDRLDRRATALSQVGATLKQLADTAKPLYQSLDDAQKQRFAILTHFLRPHRHHHRMASMDGGSRERLGGDDAGDRSWSDETVRR
jgi:zinc resistance-associated protein